MLSICSHYWELVQKTTVDCPAHDLSVLDMVDRREPYLVTSEYRCVVCDARKVIREPVPVSRRAEEDV